MSFFPEGGTFICREISSIFYTMVVEDSGPKKRFRCSLKPLQFHLLIWLIYNETSFVWKKNHCRFLMLTVNRGFTALWIIFDFCWFWLFKEAIHFWTCFANPRDHFFRSSAKKCVSFIIFSAFSIYLLYLVLPPPMY